MTETSRKTDRTVIALGMFDGMHLGHRALIGRAAEIARREGLQSMVYTFENHPGGLFGAGVPLLSTPAERRKAIGDMGIDRVEFAVFDRAMAEMPPEDFAAMLAEQYRPHTLVAGFNYTFGHKAAGTVADLRAFGARYGFAVHREEPVMDEGQPVSSTRIRAMLLDGDAEGAARLLGRPYGFTGTVIRCRHIGTSLGFPTANLAPPEGKLLPRSGVYVSRAVTAEGAFPAVTNLGDNPTVAGREITIETHILDYRGDLYEKTLTVEFLVYLRPERKFPSREALAKQIGKDVAESRRLWGMWNDTALRPG